MRSKSSIYIYSFWVAMTQQQLATLCAYSPSSLQGCCGTLALHGMFVLCSGCYLNPWAPAFQQASGCSVTAPRRALQHTPAEPC